MTRQASKQQNSIGTTIRYLRQRRGMPMKTLANRLDIGINTLGNYEMGRRLITADMLYEIAEELDYQIIIRDKEDG